MRNLLRAAMIFWAAGCMGQQPQPPEGARELFFFGSAPKDALPPIAKRAAPAKVTKAAPAPGSAAAVHLGLRYTLLLVGPPGDPGQPTDPERNFRKGDCVAINVEANRSGYLYVLARQSNGDWAPLFPTPDLPDEGNRIDPGQVVRTPRSSCFEIDDPPGSETLFVVLSRNPRDIDELAEGIKAPGEKLTQLASAERINSAVNQIAQEAGTRELPFTQVMKAPAAAPQPKVVPKAAPGKEPENAVYVVSGSNKPAATLVTRVEIHHR
jgi:hypothetical protein